MNKLLITDYLYNVFKFGATNGINLENYFNDAFNNQDFVNMVLCKPHNILEIKSLILSKRKATITTEDNKLRYLAFLIATFIDTTTIDITKIPKYIIPTEIFNNFNYYHSKDIDEVIFELIIIYNETYVNRKVRLALEDDLYLVKENFISLFPIKRFNEFKVTYDLKLSSPVFYTKEGEVLLFNSNINALLEDDYFKNKYVVGQKVYCFSYAFVFGSQSIPKNIFFFLMNESNIAFYEPGGFKHNFKIIKQKNPL